MVLFSTFKRQVAIAGHSLIAGLLLAPFSLSFGSLSVIRCLQEVGLLALALLITAWLLKRTVRFKRLGTVVIPGLLPGFICFTAGLWQGQHAWHTRLAERLPAAVVLEARVRVEQLADRDGEGWRQEVRLVSVQGEPPPFTVPQKWLLALPYNTAGTPPVMQPGEIWQISADLRPVTGSILPDGFDVEKWLLVERGIGARGFFLDGHRIRAEPAFIQSRRLAFRRLVQTGNYGAGGLLLSLTSGDKALLDQKTRDQFQLLGISHLLAISGPQLVLMASLLAMLCGHVAGRFTGIFLHIPRPYLNAVLLLAGTGFYAALTGWGVPAQRTLIMTMVSLGVFLLWGRQERGTVALPVAAAIILLLDPLATVSVSFWLSFIAVYIVLQLSVQALRTDLPLREKVRLALRQTVLQQILITLLMLPLVLFIFNKISLLSVLSNLLVVPVISLVVVPLNLLGWLAGTIDTGLGQLLLRPSDFILTQVLSLASWLATKGEQNFYFYSPFSTGVFTFALILAGLLLALRFRSVIRPAGLLVLFSGCAVIGGCMLLHRQTQVWLLDTPGTVNIWIEAPDEALLVTSMRDRDLFKSPDRTVPLMQQLGIFARRASGQPLAILTLDPGLSVEQLNMALHSQFKPVTGEDKAGDIQIAETDNGLAVIVQEPVRSTGTGLTARRLRIDLGRHADRFTYPLQITQWQGVSDQPWQHLIINDHRQKYGNTKSGNGWTESVFSSSTVTTINLEQSGSVRVRPGQAAVTRTREAWPWLRTGF